MMKRYLKCLILTDRGRSWSSFRVKSGIISFWCSTDFSSPFFPFFISNLSSVIFNLFINTFLLYDWIFMNINLSHHCYCSVEFIMMTHRPLNLINLSSLFSNEALGLYLWSSTMNRQSKFSLLTLELVHQSSYILSWSILHQGFLWLLKLIDSFIVDVPTWLKS